MAAGFNFQVLPTLNLNDPNFDIGPIFREADADGDGKISIQDAVRFFKPSNLNTTVLKQIWDRAEGGTQFLDRPRFLFAMKMIQMAMRGFSINTVSDSPQQSPSGQPGNMYAMPMPSPRPFGPGTPPLTPIAPMQGTIPEISDAERARYLDTFAKLGGNNTGFLDGSVTVPIFLRSNVPPVDLQKIWKLADFTSDNRLDAEEFAVAMHLITLKMKHGDTFQIPSSLPERFIASARRLAPQPMAPQSLSPQPMAPQPMAPQSLSPQPMTLQPMAPLPMAPLPMAPQPMAPQPMAPQPIIQTITPAQPPIAGNEVAMEKLKKENDLTMQISGKTTSIDTHKSRLEELQQYIAERESNIAQKQLQLDELHRQEEELKRMVQEQNTKLETVTRDRKALETQNAQLKARIEIQSRDFEQSKVHLVKLEQEYQRLLETSRMNSLRSEELDRDSVALKGQIQAREQEIATQLAEISQLRGNMTSNTQQQETLQNTNLRLKQQLTENRAQIAEFRKKNDDLIAEIEALDISRVEYETATKDSTNKLAELSRERDELNARFSHLQEELIAREKLYSSNSENPNFIRHLQSLARNAREQLDLFNSAMTDQIGDMEPQISALSSSSSTSGSRSGRTSGLSVKGQQANLQPAAVSSGFDSDQHWGSSFNSLPKEQHAPDSNHFEADFSDSGFNEGFGAASKPPPPPATATAGQVSTQEPSGFDDFSSSFDTPARKDDWSFDSKTSQAVIDEFPSDFSQGFDEHEFSKGFEESNFGFDSGANKSATTTTDDDGWASFS